MIPREGIRSVRRSNIAKHVFQPHSADASGQAVFRDTIPRTKLIDFLAPQPRRLGRENSTPGHALRVIPPSYVNPFRDRGVHRARMRRRVRGPIWLDRLASLTWDGTLQTEGNLTDAGPDETDGTIESYEVQQNQLPTDEAMMFAYAVHPTHVALAVRCWALKAVAITQSSGRDRLQIHGALDLETGNTRMLDVLAGGECRRHRHAADGNRGNVSPPAV